MNNPEVSTRLGEKAWSNPALLQEALSDGEPDSSWLVARWNQKPPQSGGLIVHILSPAPNTEQDGLEKLASLVGPKLHNAFRLSSLEKGWPIPRFFVQIDHPLQDNQNWTYQLELGTIRTEPQILYPNKLLAVGEEESLSPLLGLECLDPMFGLPAKWVSASQAEKATQLGCLIFESADVIMGHAINFCEVRAHDAVGSWEVNHWFLDSLKSDESGGIFLLSQHQALLLNLVRSALREGFHLPKPERFSEHVQVALTESDGNTPALELLVRREIVNDNLHRFLDTEGTLNIVEWKAPSELKSVDYHRMLGRLTQALEQAGLELASGVPVLVTELSGREELAKALANICPTLPVLSWSDLKDLTNLRTLTTVDATLRVDPTVLPAGFFSVSIDT